jgi:hypothetical protein
VPGRVEIQGYFWLDRSLFATLTFSPSYTVSACPYIADGAIQAGHCAFFAILFRESPMKTSFKKFAVLFVLAAFAAPTLSYATAAYPNNKPRPAHHKSHKHHSKKSTPAPAPAQ